MSCGNWDTLAACSRGKESAVGRPNQHAFREMLNPGLRNGHPHSIPIPFRDLEFSTISFLSTPRNEDTGPIPTLGMTELPHFISLIPKRGEMANDSYIALLQKKKYNHKAAGVMERGDVRYNI